MMIFMYLATIVVANLVVTHFGPQFLPLTAFILIPFDMVTRDYLHVRWKGQNEFYLNKMLMLVAAGSTISLLINWESKSVSVASFFALFIAGLIDTIVFELMGKKPFMVRVNFSNAASALADSFIFPLVAFSLVDPRLIFKQATAKFVGGVLWSILLSKVVGGRYGSR